jgi:hypothetical protein
MLYTGMLMTENAFYPIFLVAALALVAALEQPTRRRQALLVAACLVAFETRAQAVALGAAAVTAPLVLAAVERKGLRRGLRPWAVFYAFLALGAVAILAVSAARGRSTLTVLGAYEAATSSPYTLGGVLHFFLYHVAEIDLYVGIVPFAALVAIWLTPRLGSPGRRAFAVGTLAISFWLVAEVGAFASQSFVDRIEERNTFYLAPFALIALVGLAVDGVVPTSRRIVIAAAAVAGLLPVAIPFTRFITTSAVSDTFALLPWWWVQDHWIALGEVRTAVFVCALAAGAAFVLVPRRHALWLVVPVAAYFVLTSIVVENGRHGIGRFSTASYWAGTHAAHPDWIDRKVGRNASVVVLWTSAAGSLPLWENEFFNRSVGPVYELDGARPDNLPGTGVSRASNGWLVDSTGTAVDATYVLAPAGTSLRGKLIARDSDGVDLYRVGGPLVIPVSVTGLYPNDTWSGHEVTYRRVECGGGALAVTLAGDASLFRRQPQTVSAYEGGRRVARVAIPSNRQVVMTVPLRADADDVCTVRFRLGRTFVPARVEPAETDTRRLGAHFLGFEVKRR